MSAGKRLALDPEVVALLKEAAEHPKSMLLKSPRRQTFADYFSGEYVSSRATGLSSPEVHLLEVYREEVAKLLLDFADRSLRHTGSWLFVPNRLARDSARVVSDRENMMRRRADLERADVGDRLAFDALRVLAVDPRPLPSELANVALRLLPRERARHIIALDHVYRGRTRSAMPMLVRLATCEDAMMRSIALANAGLALERSGRLEAARAAYVQAYRVRDGRQQCIVSALTLAVRSEDQLATREIASDLDASGPMEAPELGARLAALREERPQLRVSARTERIASEVAETSTGIAREVLSVYCR